VKKKINYDQDDLYCCHCKERIKIKESYLELEEEVLGEFEIKQYHFECVPEEGDEIYIGESDE
jgi:hypothetical protein